MIMRNEKAQGISMNVVILAAIAVMVLLLVGTFMSGGFKALTGKITSFVSSGPSSELSAAKTACDNKCNDWKQNGCSAGLFEAVDVQCSGNTLTLAAAWPQATTDPRDGLDYTSNCRIQIGQATPIDCTAALNAYASLTDEGNYVEYNVRGAGGSCGCKVSWKSGGPSGGWGS